MSHIIAFILGFLIGLTIATSIVSNYYKSQAIDRHFAEYQVDNKGHVTFVWKK